jgi:hypothetical protein
MLIMFIALTLVSLGYLTAVIGGIIAVGESVRSRFGWFLAAIGVCAGGIGFFLPIAAGTHIFGLSF